MTSTFVDACAPAPDTTPGEAAADAPPPSVPYRRSARPVPDRTQERHRTHEDEPLIPKDYALTPGLRAALVAQGIDPSRLREPSAYYGAFSTGVRLAAALYGPEGDRRATTRGQIWKRLGMAGGSKQTKRMDATAVFYGLEVITRGPRDGAPIGESVVDDDARLVEAHRYAATMRDLVLSLGLRPSGSTNLRVRARLHELGLTDPSQPCGPRPRARA